MSGIIITSPKTPRVNPSSPAPYPGPVPGVSSEAPSAVADDVPDRPGLPQLRQHVLCQLNPAVPALPAAPGAAPAGGGVQRGG